jgi:tRNA1(Val) A37 N6-methylase TrmN6
VRLRGSATLILPASRMTDGLRALGDAGFGSPALLPLWPRAGMAAKRVILAARRGGKGPDRLLPGLALHEGAGHGADAAAILRDGAALAVG